MMQAQMESFQSVLTRDLHVRALEIPNHVSPRGFLIAECKFRLCGNLPLSSLI